MFSVVGFTAPNSNEAHYMISAAVKWQELLPPTKGVLTSSNNTMWFVELLKNPWDWVTLNNWLIVYADEHSLWVNTVTQTGARTDGIVFIEPARVPRHLKFVAPSDPLGSSCLGWWWWSGSPPPETGLKPFLRPRAASCRRLRF